MTIKKSLRIWRMSLYRSKYVLFIVTIKELVDVPKPNRGWMQGQWPRKSAEVLFENAE